MTCAYGHFLMRLVIITVSVPLHAGGNVGRYQDASRSDEEMTGAPQEGFSATRAPLWGIEEERQREEGETAAAQDEERKARFTDVSRKELTLYPDESRRVRQQKRQSSSRRVHTPRRERPAHLERIIEESETPVHTYTGQTAQGSFTGTTDERGPKAFQKLKQYVQEAQYRSYYDALKEIEHATTDKALKKNIAKIKPYHKKWKAQEIERRIAELQDLYASAKSFERHYQSDEEAPTSVPLQIQVRSARSTRTQGDDLLSPTSAASPTSPVSSPSLPGNLD